MFTGFPKNIAKIIKEFYKNNKRKDISIFSVKCNSSYKYNLCQDI